MTIEERFDQFNNIFEYLGLFALAILALSVIEFLWDISKTKKQTWGQSGANVIIGIGNTLLERTTYGILLIIAFTIVEPFAIFEISIDNTWSWFLAIIAADLTYYWMHRVEHHVRFLWAYHSVHHSSPEFNLTTGLRLAWWEGLFEWIFFLPLIIIGFDLVQAIFAILFVVTYQSWIHTGKIDRLGWLEGIINTPAAHRVHHGSNRTCIDKNFGGIFMIWDRIFGTYQVVKTPIKYGIFPAVKSNNPLVINFYELYQIYNDIASTPWKQKVLCIFKTPK
jgi:sterol desaturase/sphingolipid hydroxylase (fatty acid hydroxylase superfamily)